MQRTGFVEEEVPSWTFLTNHAHVLICIAQDQESRLRDIAWQVGITERQAQAIVNDLVADGYVTRTRVGRRNHYEVHENLPFRHPIERDHNVGELLDVLGVSSRKRARVRAASRAR